VTGVDEFLFIPMRFLGGNEQPETQKIMEQESHAKPQGSWVINGPTKLVRTDVHIAGNTFHL
jgi:hypothetical protein